MITSSISMKAIIFSLHLSQKAAHNKALDAIKCIRHFSIRVVWVHPDSRTAHNFARTQSNDSLPGDVFPNPIEGVDFHLHRALYAAVQVRTRNAHQRHPLRSGHSAEEKRVPRVKGTQMPPQALTRNRAYNDNGLKRTMHSIGHQTIVSYNINQIGLKSLLGCTRYWLVFLSHHRRNNSILRLRFSTLQFRLWTLQFRNKRHRHRTLSFQRAIFWFNKDSVFPLLYYVPEPPCEVVVNATIATYIEKFTLDPPLPPSLRV